MVQIIAQRPATGGSGLDRSVGRLVTHDMTALEQWAPPAQGGAN